MEEVQAKAHRENRSQQKAAHQLHESCPVPAVCSRRSCRGRKRGMLVRRQMWDYRILPCKHLKMLLSGVSTHVGTASANLVNGSSDAGLRRATSAQAAGTFLQSPG